MRASSAEIERLPADFRLKALRDWHIVEGVCWRCKRIGPIDKRLLMRGRNPDARLVDLENKLRCKVCNEAGPAARHNIYVRKAPRN